MPSKRRIAVAAAPTPVLKDADHLDSVPPVTKMTSRGKSRSKKEAPSQKPTSEHAQEDVKAIASRKRGYPALALPSLPDRASTKQGLQGGRAAKKVKVASSAAVLNRAPAQRLNVYVFGDNSNGELGLGSTCTSHSVPRPRLNPNLPAASVGVVQLAAGAMHCAVLTYDNQILTWGVNDHGALGRDTTWEGGMVDVAKDDASSNDDEGNMNPREATPTAIDTSTLPEGTVFTQIVAGDNATFALTETGLVYGWGTFRGNDGVFGFSPTAKFQKEVALVPGLRKVTKLVAGSNHVVALTADGAVLAWGAGEQNQLGRRIVMRSKTKTNALIPREFGLRKGAIDIGAGADHSFAIHKNGTVYGWGLNNYGQTGVGDGAGEAEAAILHPAFVKSLTDHGRVRCIGGGNHHTIAVTEQGACLVWGRVDACATGLKLTDLPNDDVIRDDRGRPRILKRATPVPRINATHAAAGSDHSLAVTEDGKAYSWGFSDSYQTGLGTDEDVEIATLVDNTAVRGKKLVWAGAGARYSVLTGEDGPTGVNGR